MAKRSGPKATCEACGRQYRKDRYNVHRQKFCRHEVCVTARAQKAQREWYRQQYRNDKAFQESERKRCGESLKARREKAKPKPEAEVPAAAAADATPNFELVMLGMTETLLDAPDAQTAWAFVRSCERRGRKLAAARPLVRGSPGG